MWSAEAARADAGASPPEREDSEPKDERGEEEERVRERIGAPAEELLARVAAAHHAPGDRVQRARRLHERDAGAGGDRVGSHDAVDLKRHLQELHAESERHARPIEPRLLAAQQFRAHDGRRGRGERGGVPEGLGRDSLDSARAQEERHEHELNERAQVEPRRCDFGRNQSEDPPAAEEPRHEPRTVIRYDRRLREELHAHCARPSATPHEPPQPGPAREGHEKQDQTLARLARRESLEHDARHADESEPHLRSHTRVTCIFAGELTIIWMRVVYIFVWVFMAPAAHTPFTP